jgi:hypothetical protein
MSGHVSDEGDYVESYECCGVALVVFDQPAATSGLCEGLFYDPASGQQDKAALCLWQFDDVQRDALGRGGIRGCLCGVTLIDIGKPDAVSGRVLDIRMKSPDRGPVADIGRSDAQGEQVAKRFHGHMHLRPALALGTVRHSRRRCLSPVLSARCGCR